MTELITTTAAAMTAMGFDSSKQVSRIHRKELETETHFRTFNEGVRDKEVQQEIQRVQQADHVGARWSDTEHGSYLPSKARIAKNETARPVGKKCDK